ncbi:MAG: Gfo/Idh/MocA family oxidoreductase [Armatimonadetes bacterium]|nr:Gfo/Idh/MocA family oxidoreductase [Armatimonadota bacterium]
MSVLGAGVIGMGMGASHVEAFSNHPSTEVRGVCDVNLDRARAVAGRYNIGLATGDYRELLRRDDIHIISVSTPDMFHEEQAVAALEAGKDVLCEKPMALHIEECERMIAAADRTGRRLMIGQVCRYTPGFMLAKRLIDRGDIGELFFAESEYAHDYAGLTGWRSDPKIMREPFIGGACHAVDLVRWIAGDMEEVFAYANRRVLTDWPVDDCTIATFKFLSGAVGKVFCSIGCKRPYTMRSVFYGTKGTIITDNTSPAIDLCATGLPETAGGFIKLPVNINSHNVTSEVAELVSAILENRPVNTDGREGARTVAACRAAVESAATGKPVKVRTEF